MSEPTRAPAARPTDARRLRRMLRRLGLSPDAARRQARAAVLAGRAPLKWGRVAP
jgi:hypothetical protein